MAKTVFENEEKVEKVKVVGYVPRVKQMVRSVAQFTAGTQDAIQSVDAELSGWVNDGWTLLSTHYMGNDAQGGWMVLYVLTRD